MSYAVTIVLYFHSFCLLAAATDKNDEEWQKFIKLALGVLAFTCGLWCSFNVWGKM